MSYFEYMVVPAPREAPRRKGVRSTEARFAHGLSDALNDHAADGWEFQRTETLTAEASTGWLRRKSVETVTVMVFRRWVETVDEAEYDRSRGHEASLRRMEPSPQLRPVPLAEPPAEARVERAPNLEPPTGRPQRDPRRNPLLGANRRADLPLRPVPGPDRG